jgi:hypothetical protein
VIKYCENVLRNNHQFLGVNIARTPLEESHIHFYIAQDTLRYAKPALPQAGIYNDKIGDIDLE